MSEVDAVVVAAGASARMGGLDKLLAPVAGRPLLAWTLDAVATAEPVRRIVLVAAPARVAEFAAAPWLSPRVSAVVAGGPRRQDSVAAGVAALGAGGQAPAGSPGSGGPGPAGRDVVLVHDGARPLVSPGLLAAVAAAAAEHGAAIPVVPVAETLKRVEGERIVATVERTALAAAQTPQGIRRDVLARAWALRPPAGPATWTDEAALLEACRIPVHAVPGESMNLKVTTPDDLALVEAALALRDQRAGISPPAQRVGFGDDSHSFGPGTPLVLGGVVIDGAPRLHGHSDGDVVLHAVCDALLGAGGLGDLGRAFPAGPATPAGISSGDLLEACLRRLAEAGLAPRSVDVTVVGARPRLAGRLDAMAGSIAGLLGLPAGGVSVKASTGNLAGFEGAGRGIAARAVAVVGASPPPGGRP